MTYGSFTTVFVANSTTTTLRFADATTGGEAGTADGVLDNIQMNVENPNTLNVVNGSFENFDSAANTPNNTELARFAGWNVDTGTGPGALLIDDTNNARIQVGKDGNQFLQINNTLGTATQEYATLLQVDTAYKLTVAIGVATGDFNAGFLSQGAKLELLAQDPNGSQTVIGTSTISGATINAVTGTLSDYSLYVPSGSYLPSLFGEQLVLRLTSLYTGGNSENIFDNVRLLSIAVPEPTSLGMLAGGAFLLLRRRSHLMHQRNS